MHSRVLILLDSCSWGRFRLGHFHSVSSYIVTKERLEYLETKIGDSADQHAKVGLQIHRNSPYEFQTE